MKGIISLLNKDMDLFFPQKNKYKFIIVLDEENNKTIAILETQNKKFIKYYSKNLFFNIYARISGILKLPYDTLTNAYDGDEIYIRIEKNKHNIIWRNLNDKNYVQYPPKFKPNPNDQLKYDYNASILFNVMKILFENEMTGIFEKGI